MRRLERKETTEAPPGADMPGCQRQIVQGADAVGIERHRATAPHLRPVGLHFDQDEADRPDNHQERRSKHGGSPVMSKRGVQLPAVMGGRSRS